MGRQLLPNTERGVGEQEKDFFLALNLKNQNNPMYPDYVNFTINQAEVAFQERNNSQKFNLHGNISVTTPLRNLSFQRPVDYDILSLEEKQLYDYSDLSIYALRSSGSSINDLNVNVIGTVPFKEFDFEELNSSLVNWETYIGYFGSSTIIENNVNGNPNLIKHNKNIHLLPINIKWGENKISKDLFSNKNYNFYAELIDLTNLVDYLNRPLTELLLIYVKKVDTTYLDVNRTYSFDIEEFPLNIASPTLEIFDYDIKGFSSDTSIVRSSEKSFIGNFSLKQNSGVTQYTLNYDFTLAREYTGDTFSISFVYNKESNEGINTLDIKEVFKNGFSSIIENISYTEEIVNEWVRVNATCNLTASTGNPLRLSFSWENINNTDVIYYDEFIIKEDNYSGITLPFIPSVEISDFDSNIFEEVDVIESRQIVEGIGRVGRSSILPNSSYVQRESTDPLSLLNEIDDDIITVISNTDEVVQNFEDASLVTGITQDVSGVIYTNEFFDGLHSYLTRFNDDGDINFSINLILPKDYVSEEITITFAAKYPDTNLTTTIDPRFASLGRFNEATVESSTSVSITNVSNWTFYTIKAIINGLQGQLIRVVITDDSNIDLLLDTFTVKNVREEAETGLDKFAFNWYYKIPFRVFSDVTESLDILSPLRNDIIPPNYAIALKNEVGDTSTLVWRNVLPVGLIEPGTNTGVDYPFLNGSHYIYFKHNLTISFNASFTNLDGNAFDLIRPFDYNDFTVDSSTNVSTTEVNC